MSFSGKFSRKSSKQDDTDNDPERNVETPEQGRRRRATKANPLLNAQTDDYADDSDLYTARISRMQKLQYYTDLLQNKGKRPLPFGFRSWRTKEIAETNELSMYPKIYSIPFRIFVNNFWDQLYLALLLLEIILLIMILDGWAAAFAPMILSLNAGNQLLMLPPLFMFITQLIPFLAGIYYTSHCNDLVRFLGIKNFQAWAFAATLTVQYVEYFYYSGKGKRHLAGECRYGHIRHPGRIQRFMSKMVTNYYLRSMKADAKISPSGDDDGEDDNSYAVENATEEGRDNDLGALEEGLSVEDDNNSDNSDNEDGEGKDGSSAGEGDNEDVDDDNNNKKAHKDSTASATATATAAITTPKSALASKNKGPLAQLAGKRGASPSLSSTKKSVRISDEPQPTSNSSTDPQQNASGHSKQQQKKNTNQEEDEGQKHGAGNDDNDDDNSDDDENNDEDGGVDIEEGKESQLLQGKKEKRKNDKKDKKNKKHRKKNTGNNDDGDDDDNDDDEGELNGAALKLFKGNKKSKKVVALEDEEEENPIEMMEWTCIVCNKQNNLPRHPTIDSDVVFGETGVYYKRMFATIQARRDMPTCPKCLTYADYKPPESSAHLFPHNPDPHGAFESYPPGIEVHSGLRIDKTSIYWNAIKSFFYGLRNDIRSKVMKNDWRLRKFVMDRFPEVPKLKLKPGESFELGEIIECRQQKFEWTRARIILVRTNKTYDIRYDPGDELRFVSEHAIRLRPEKRKYAYRVEMGMVLIAMITPLGLAMGMTMNNPGMMMLGVLIVGALLLSIRLVVMVQYFYNYYHAGLCAIFRLTGLYALPLLFLTIGGALGLTAGLDPNSWSPVITMLILAQFSSLPVLYIMRPPFAVIGLLMFAQTSIGMVLSIMQFSNPAALTYYGIAFAPFITFTMCMMWVRRNLHNIWDTCVIIRPAQDTSADNPNIWMTLWDAITEQVDILVASFM